MVHTTSQYYTQFTSTVSATSLKIWTKEITSAEGQRLKDPCAMDIMRANQLDDFADPAQTDSEQTRLTGVGAQWLNLALSIEERQYALVIS